MGSSEKIENNAIIIDLQESSNAKSYGTGKRIHLREFESVTKLIETRVDKYDPKDKNRYNDTISILGSRGSGKTSFLLSLLSYYRENKKYKDQVEVLEIIDPTLIEEKGHIFLTIIALIEESVCRKLNLNDCSPNDAKYCHKKEWKDKLRKLADGLPSMDGVGLGLNDTNWQDAEFIMDRGLKSVKAASKLEANFNELVNFALDILGKEKKAFIITLDDIDVDFRKGWPVLETIRKYLTSPQIIVLLSGDLKLYSKAIRKQQWKNFGKALLINEGEKLRKVHEYNDLVTEMESQYMQKVVKPENRVHLTSLYEKVTTYGSELSINILKKNHIDEKQVDREDIIEFYNKILESFGIRNSYQAEVYTSFFLSLPVRTQIQFLSGINPTNLDLSGAFLSDLYEKEVDVELAKRSPKMLNVVILKLLIKEQMLSEVYQLQPNTTDISLNSSLSALSFLFSLHSKKDPYLIFDYMIKIGYARNLLTDLGYAEKKDKKGTSMLKPSIEGLCHHSGIFQDKVLRDVVGNMTAYIESLPNRNENKNGIVYLRASATREKGKVEDAIGRIDYEFGRGDAELTNLQQILAFIPLSISEFIEKKYGSFTFSIYTLIGTIGELIRKMELNDLNNGLLELSQWRTYPMVSFERGLANLTYEEEYNEIPRAQDDKGYSVFIESFKEWYSKFLKMKKCYSPHLIGKISTRIYYSFNSIKDVKECNLNLGVATHRRLIALMNAILIEDVRENCLNSQGLNINNAVTKDDVFLNNLDFANEIKDSNFNFSRWMLSCPLFLLYLNKEFLRNQKFIDFAFSKNNERLKMLENLSIYEKLCRVDLRGQTNVKSNSIEGQIAKNSNKPKFRSSRLSEREKVISVLINNKIPYSLFAIGIGQHEQQLLNSIIRDKCKNLFAEETLHSNHLRGFRNFLNSDDASNLKLIKQWKQAQF